MCAFYISVRFKNVSNVYTICILYVSRCFEDVLNTMEPQKNLYNTTTLILFICMGVPEIQLKRYTTPRPIYILYL